MNSNQISLSGIINQDLKQRSNAQGDYYFTFLWNPDRKYAIPLFLWQPDYLLTIRAEQELTANQEITAYGEWSKDNKFFYLRDWTLENQPQEVLLENPVSGFGEW